MPYTARKYIDCVGFNTRVILTLSPIHTQSIRSRRYDKSENLKSKLRSRSKSVKNYVRKIFFLFSMSLIHRWVRLTKVVRNWKFKSHQNVNGKARSFCRLLALSLSMAMHTMRIFIFSLNWTKKKFQKDELWSDNRWRRQNLIPIYGF